MSENVQPSPAVPASAEPHSTDHYSDIALDHLTRPRNVGTLTDPSGTGTDANPSCGDRTTITVRVRDGTIAELRFRTFGCTAAIAAASVLTELATGKRTDDAARLEPADILNALGGLPARKEACALMAIGALRGALIDARVRDGTTS
jgi:nitrogen fixation NifU-like protein